MQIYSMMDKLPDNEGKIGWCGGFEIDSEATLSIDVDNESGTQYMFSAWLKCNQYGIISPNELNVSKGDYVNANAWKRVSFITDVIDNQVNLVFSQGKWQIYKAQLERGNKLTDWKENADEASVENVYVRGTTQIDGGKIYTDSIKAESIDVDEALINKVFAEHIEAGDINVTGDSVVAGWNVTENGFKKEIFENAYYTISNITPKGTIALQRLDHQAEDRTQITDSKTMNLTHSLLLFLSHMANNEGFQQMNLTSKNIIFGNTANSNKSEISDEFIKISDETNSCSITPRTLNVTNDTTNSISLPNATTKSLASINLTKGKYLVIGSVSFENNSSGYRIIGMSPISDIFTGVVSRNATANAVNGDRTNIQVQVVINVTSASANWYLLAKQNSGSELSGNMANIEAIRLQ